MTVSADQKEPSGSSVWSRLSRGRLFVLACVGIIAYGLYLSTQTELDRRRTSELIEARLRIRAGMSISDVQEILGEPPDLQENENVVWNGQLLLAASNPKAMQYGEAENLQVTVWSGRATHLTVVSSLDGIVRGSMVWHEPEKGPAWARILRRIQSLF